jgi:hypothetical protein
MAEKRDTRSATHVGKVDAVAAQEALEDQQLRPERGPSGGALEVRHATPL